MDDRPLSSRVVVWLGHLLILAGAVVGAVFALRVLAGRSEPSWHAALSRLFPFAALSLSVDGRRSATKRPPSWFQYQRDLSRGLSYRLMNDEAASSSRRFHPFLKVSGTAPRGGRRS
jgi:hypothetical protein